MRRAFVEELQPGMVVGKEILNERGDVLLAQGVTLTPRYIEVLKDLGYYAIYVRDGVADDVEPPDILSDRVRIATAKHIRQLFSLAQDTAARSAQNQRSTAVNPTMAAAPNFSQLYLDVERIIDRAMNAQVLSGVTSLKNHDNYTFEHSVEVAVVGVMLGIRLRLPPSDLHQLALGCLCHDIGKLAVPQDILNKRGRLKEEELILVRKHADAGYEIARQIMGTADVIARHVVWQHHERQDGNGYPRGLRGLNKFTMSRDGHFGRGLILPTAEIAALAEVYCGLASDQVYRPALPPAQIVNVLLRMAGTHLNADIVRRFLSMLPLYPIGTQVAIISGRLQGLRGVVTQVNPSDIQRPVVRILFGPNGTEVPPFEVDTSADGSLELAVAPNPEPCQDNLADANAAGGEKHSNGPAAV